MPKKRRLSNGALSDEDKLRYIGLYHLTEEKKVDLFSEFPLMNEKIGAEKIKRFKELLGKKCKWLREHLHDNATWEWQGGANLLVTGVCVK